MDFIDEYDRRRVITGIIEQGTYATFALAANPADQFRSRDLVVVDVQFAGHGAQEIVELLNKDTEHPATKDFGASWNINGKREEMYLFKSYHQTNVHELLVMDKHPNSKAAGNYPVAWCKEFGKGKVF